MKNRKEIEFLGALLKCDQAHFSDIDAENSIIIIPDSLMMILSLKMYSNATFCNLIEVEVQALIERITGFKLRTLRYRSMKEFLRTWSIVQSIQSINHNK